MDQKQTNKPTIGQKNNTNYFELYGKENTTNQNVWDMGRTQCVQKKSNIKCVY